MHWVLLLQPLQWCCVDCVIHHERDVREEQHHAYMWGEQAIIEWSWHVNSIVACCHSVKLCAYAARNFQSQQYLCLFLILVWIGCRLSCAVEVHIWSYYTFFKYILVWGRVLLKDEHKTKHLSYLVRKDDMRLSLSTTVPRNLHNV